MYLKINAGTAGYNKEILVSDGTFSLGKNSKPADKTAILKHTPIPKPTKVESLSQKQTNKVLELITPQEEKIALILLLTGGFTTWYVFR